MKRLTAAVMIAVLSLCLCSCGYNPQVVGSVKSADGKETEISCGRYLIAQFTASDSALYTVDSTGSTDFATMLEGKVDGKDAREWIKDETERLLKRAIAVDGICKEHDISFTPDERYVYEYSIGYGWSNYHNIYMANGVSYDTFYDYQMNIAMDSELGHRLYGTGGPMQLSDELVQDYLDNKTARLTFIKTPATPTDSTVTLTDEQYAKLDELAKQLYADVQADGFDAAVEKYEPLYEEILGEGCFTNAYTKDTLTFSGDGKFADAMMNALLGTKTGEYNFYDAGAHSYCVFHRDGLKDTDTLDYIRDNVSYVLGTEMAEDLIDEYSKGLTVELDQKAAKYYSVDKVTFN